MGNPLAKNHPVDTITSLIDDLGSSDGSVRQAARNKLAASGPPAIPALITALSDCNDHARWESAKILGEIQDPSSIPALAKAMEDKNVDVRWAAAESLVKFRHNAVASILIMLVNDFDAVWLREGTRYVLRQLKKNGYLDQDTLKVLDSLDGPAPGVEAAWSAKSVLDKMHIDWKNEIQFPSSEGQREIDIAMGAEVKCSDGQCGLIERVVINPSTLKVTHLVVKRTKASHAEYLVPVVVIIKSSPTSIHLSCSTSELDSMATYKREHIPHDELVIRHGIRVVAIDGEAGTVDEFLIEPEDGKITHLILREKRTWGEEDVNIPVVHIDRIEEDGVYLNIEKCAIDFLPSLPLNRRKQRRDE
jgi:HEAT repeats/PRC-barrel domain